MHFLCLHGMGTNSQIFEIQTAALRYELGDHHTFDFVEGSMRCPIALEIKSMYPADGEYFQYFDINSASSALKALNDLDAYIEAEGPYDAVLAFSQGAALAATLMIRKLRQNPVEQHLSPLFKCGVFISGGIPADYGGLLDGKIRLLSHAEDGELIPVPTANIWGQDEGEFSGNSKQLAGLCQSQGRVIFIHKGGHEVPGSRSRDAVTASVNAVRRTIQTALHAQ